MRFRAVILQDYIDLWRTRAWDWSSANCTHFAAGWVREIEDFDPLAAAPQYEGMMGAGRVLVGDGGLRGVVSRLLNREPIVPAMAHLGDVVLFAGSAYGLLGLCNGHDVALFCSPSGVRYVGIDGAEAAWPVAR